MEARHFFLGGVKFPWRWIIASVLIVISARDCASQYRKIDSLEAVLDTATKQTKVRVLIRLCVEYKQIDIDSAIAYGRKAEAAATDLQYNEGVFDAYWAMRNSYAERNDVKNGMILNKKMLEIARLINDQKRTGIAYFFIGVQYKNLHQYAKALENLEKALAIQESLGNKREVVYILNSIGNVLNHARENKRAIVYYEKVLDNAHPESEAVPAAHTSLGELYSEEGELDKALMHMNKALAFYTDHSKYSNILGYALMTKGVIYLQMKEHRMATATLKRAASVYQELKNLANYSIVLIQLARVAIVENNTSVAESYLRKALAIANDQQPTDVKRLAWIYELLIEIERSRGNFQAALALLEKRGEFKDSLLLAMEREKINELSLQAELKDTESATVDLREKNTYKQIALALLIALSIGGIIIVILITTDQRRTINTGQIQHRQLSSQLRLKLEEETLLKNELEGRSKEMTSLALNMIQKKEVLASIRNEIEQIAQAAEGDMRTTLRRITSSIKLSEHMEKEWDTFRRYFDQVHRGFFDNLQLMCPELNANDLKLCALLKLNLDTKQIASVMDISSDSAKVAKHRIRKKLGLTGADNMIAFFTTVTNAPPINR